MYPFNQSFFHPIIHSDIYNARTPGPINQIAVSFQECQNKGGTTRQCEEGAQALLHITILYVCVTTARAHRALLCSQDTKAYTIANGVAHRLMDSSLTSSNGHPFLMATPIYASLEFRP